MSYDINDEGSLRRLIDLLEQAYKTAYSLKPSSIPAEVLLDLMIDSALQLRQEFKEVTGTWQARSNPELQFLEKPLKFSSKPRYQGLGVEGASFGTSPFSKRRGGSGSWEGITDELGNVAQKRFSKTQEITANPELVKFFTQLAEILVKVKHEHKLPKDLYSKEEKPRQQPTSKISPETYWYLKRRKDRLRNHHTHDH